MPEDVLSPEEISDLLAGDSEQNQGLRRKSKDAARKKDERGDYF